MHGKLVGQGGNINTAAANDELDQPVPQTSGLGDDMDSVLQWTGLNDVTTDSQELLPLDWPWLLGT